MRCFHVTLNEEYCLQGGLLTCMVNECPMDEPQPGWNRPAVIVVPGGDYQFCSKRESEPVANYFLSKGFQAFVLTYKTCADHVHYPEELLELASAVDYVRKHAEELYVNPNAVFVVGFSAGGHLTANLAVDHAHVSELAGKPLDCRPTAVCLSYPVITTKAGYCSSHNNLLDGYTEEEKTELMKRLELDEMVTDATTPAFVWTTAEDSAVPAENAIRFALALAKNGIAYEMHIYPQGNHGGSTWASEINPGVEALVLQKNVQWLENCTSFFRLF